VIMSIPKQFIPYMEISHEEGFQIFPDTGNAQNIRSTIQSER